MHARFETMSVSQAFSLRWLILLAALQLALRRSYCASSGATPLGDKYSNSFSVEIRGGLGAVDEIAKRYGFRNRGKIGSLDDIYLFELETGGEDTQALVKESTSSPMAFATSAALIRDKERRMNEETCVSTIHRQKLQVREKRAYSPPTDPRWSKQWSLLNTGQVGSGSAGRDINVEPVWLQGITGKGVTVAVVDDGVWHTHEDLSPNFDAEASYDFVDSDGDAMPGTSNGRVDNHGTSCAGVIAMVKDNGVCGVGVAYDAKIAGLRLIYGSTTDAREASALGYLSDHIHIYTNSWGPLDNGFLVEGPGDLLNAVLKNGVERGREGKGSIFVWAAGNGGHKGDTCATDGYVASIYTIAVGAVDQNGRPAYYEEKCTSKLAVTFNHNTDARRRQQITTVHAGGTCREDFLGTSATCPLVSGAIALALQANPTLSWRDVQYLIVYTSKRSRLLSAGQWSQNGAGLWVSESFGFGVIDAEALVTRARNWASVPAQRSLSFYPELGNSTSASPDAPILIPFTVGNDTELQYLEHVVIEISLSLEGFSDIYSYSDYVIISSYIGTVYNKQDLEDLVNHNGARRGDISISLQSPHGTHSLLLPHRDPDFVNSEGFSSWPFTSVLHWGENPRGEWSLSVSYRSQVGYVNVSEVKVTMYGTRVVPVSVGNMPSECNKECQGGCAADGADFCDSCKELRDPLTLACLETCPEHSKVINGYCIDPIVNITYTYTEPTIHQLLPSSTPATSLAITPRSQSTSSSTISHSRPPATRTHSPTISPFPTPFLLPTLAPSSSPDPVDLGPVGKSNSRATAGPQPDWASFTFCFSVSVSLVHLLHTQLPIL